MTFGFGQFSKLRKIKLSDNTRFLGNSISPFVPTIGGGSTTVSPGNGYTYTTFTGSGTLIINTPQVVDIFVVAGGGAGGTKVNSSDIYYSGGGGGGGGVVYAPAVPLSTGEYVIIVGAGAGDNLTSTGSDSVVSTSAGTSLVRAKGGGTGGSPTPIAASPGGSGGGAVYPSPVGTTATQPTTPQPGISTFVSYGNAGSANSGVIGGSGGGGAGGAGQPGPPATGTSGGNGGNGLDTTLVPFRGSTPSFAGPLIGVPALSPLVGSFAGGGGGGGYSSPSLGGSASGGGGGGGGGTPGGTGGTSTGGNPGTPGATPGVAAAGGSGLANSGGGGGGAGNGGIPNSGTAAAVATGGSGIVIVRYFSGP